MELYLTEPAWDALRGALEEQDRDVVKIGVKPGGCAGLQYAMSFVAPEEEDDLYHPSNAGELEGYDETGFCGFYVEENHAPVLDGITIDYVETMMGGGFKIENPNAERSCGCGKSFG